MISSTAPSDWRLGRESLKEFSLLVGLSVDSDYWDIEKLLADVKTKFP